MTRCFIDSVGPHAQLVLVFQVVKQCLRQGHECTTKRTETEHLVAETDEERQSEATYQH